MPFCTTQFDVRQASSDHTLFNEETSRTQVFFC
jgi:hypothetical protein